MNTGSRWSAPGSALAETRGSWSRSRRSQLRNHTMAVQLGLWGTASPGGLLAPEIAKGRLGGGGRTSGTAAAALARLYTRAAVESTAVESATTKRGVAAARIKAGEKAVEGQVLRASPADGAVRVVGAIGGHWIPSAPEGMRLRSLRRRRWRRPLTIPCKGPRWRSEGSEECLMDRRSALPEIRDGSRPGEPWTRVPVTLPPIR